MQNRASVALNSVFHCLRESAEVGELFSHPFVGLSRLNGEKASGEWQMW